MQSNIGFAYSYRIQDRRNPFTLDNPLEHNIIKDDSPLTQIASTSWCFIDDSNPFEPKTIVYENQETYHNPYKLNEGMEYEIYSTALPPITEENPAEVKINNDELAALANKWKYDDMLFTCAEAWMAYMNGWEGLSSSSAADEEYSAASRTISEYSFTTETTHCRSESSFSEQSDMSFFEALPEGYPYTYLGSPRKPRRRGFASSFRRKPQSNFGATPTTGGVEVLK